MLCEQILFALFSLTLTLFALYTLAAPQASGLIVTLAIAQLHVPILSALVVYPAYKLAFLADGQSYALFCLGLAALSAGVITAIAALFHAHSPVLFTLTLIMAAGFCLRSLGIIAKRFQASLISSAVSLTALIFGLSLLPHPTDPAAILWIAVLAKLAPLPALWPKARRTPRPKRWLKRHIHVALRVWPALLAEYFRIYGFYIVLGAIGPAALVAQVRQVEILVAPYRQIAAAGLVSALSGAHRPRLFAALALLAPMSLMPVLILLPIPITWPQSLALMAVIAALFPATWIILWHRARKAYARLSITLCTASIIAGPCLLITPQTPTAILIWLAGFETLIFALGLMSKRVP